MDLLGGYVGPEKIPSVLCAHLKNCNIGDLVELNGQLFRRTNKFAELRDKTGVVQLIVDEERTKGAQNVSIVNGDIEIQIVSFPNKDNILNSTLQIKSVSQAPQITLKRAYSTMSEANPLGITLSEYKHATTENLIQYFVNRDWTTAELTEHDVGKTVKLIGWLNDFNKNSTQFQQLKDGYGVIQVVALRDEHQKILEIAANSSLLVEVTGRVTKRPTHSVNVKIPTGTIEIQVSTARALGPDDPYDGPVKFKKTKIDSEEIVTNQTAAVNKFTYRTHNCSELRIENVGQKVTLCGWVQFLRMKKFIVLRDGYGVTQVLVPIDNELIHKHINNINFESVIRVQGTVVPRPENMKNPDQETGDIEVRAESIEVLNEAMANLPMDLREHNKAEENLRLTHRYIDLRSPDMQYNLRTRSAVIMKMRECLINKYGFVEVETPTLFRSTPGGAQEFLVPSRRAGKFYSLVRVLNNLSKC
uniref:Aminoacyl-transfer RNA synthetases class-II family profile domain-containing protein n=1 Tax=Megaselia scalaris TaxID=36166 RepID=T1GL64_MEGSC